MSDIHSMLKPQLLEECIRRGEKIKRLERKLEETQKKIIPIKPQAVDDGFSEDRPVVDDGVTYLIKTCTGKTVRAVWCGHPNIGCWKDAERGYTEIDTPVSYKPTPETKSELERRGRL